MNGFISSVWALNKLIIILMTFRENAGIAIILLMFLPARILDFKPFFILLPSRGWRYLLLVVFLY